MVSASMRPRGELLGRFLRSLAGAGGEYEVAHRFALQRWPGERVAGAILKAQAASISGSTWGSEADALGTVRSEFVELVQARTIAGQLDARRVPMDVRVISTGSGSAAAWVAEGAAVPVSELTMDEETVRPLKVAAISVMTNEFLRSGSPRIEQFLVRELVRATRYALDTAFIDVANAGTAGVKRVSITYAATTLTATGGFGSEAEIAALKSDVRKMLAAYTGSWDSAVFIVNSSLAMALQLASIPILGPSDASIIPVIHNGNVPGDGGSPEGDILVLADSSAIITGDMDVVIDATTQGDLVMSGSSMNVTTPAPANVTSLWQTNATAVKAMISTNWNAPPAGRVIVLSGIPRL